MNEMLNNLSGVELLKEAFPNPGSLEPQMPEGSDGIQPIEDDFWDHPISDEQIESSEWVDRKVAEEGVEVLAWYNPYRDYGVKNWGIYFDERKMNAFASGIYRQVKKIRPSAKYSEVRRIVWQAVERHEYEHCVQELVLATARHLNAGTWPLSTLDFAPQGDGLEAIATHQMILDPRITGISEKQILNLTMHILGLSPKPSGYSDWNRVDIENLENKFLDFVDRYLPRKILQKLRGKLLSKRGTVWLQVPRYRV